MKLSSRNSALLIVDVQKDFCEAGFACAQSGRDIGPMRTMVRDKLLPFLQAWRSAGRLTIFIAAHYPRGKFQADGFPELCVQETPGAELYLVQPNVRSENERVFYKSELDAFSNPELDQYLRARVIEQVVISGVTTDKCVRATVLGALHHGYHPVVVADLVAAGAHRAREHREALEHFRAQQGVEVVESRALEI